MTDRPHSLVFKIGTPWHELERQAIELGAHAWRQEYRCRLLGVAVRTIYRHLNRQEQQDVSTEQPTTISKSAGGDSSSS